MDMDLGDLNAFLAVARARGFRHGAKASAAVPPGSARPFVDSKRSSA